MSRCYYYCFATGQEKKSNLQNGYCVTCQKENCQISIWMLQHPRRGRGRSGRRRRSVHWHRIPDGEWWEYYNYCNTECLSQDPMVSSGDFRHLRECPGEGKEIYITPSGLRIEF